MLHTPNRNERPLCGNTKEAVTFKFYFVDCKACVSIVELVAEGKNCEMCGRPIKVMTPPAKGICSENCLKDRDE